MRAVLAIGTEDSSGTRSGENLATMIENLRGQGYTEFAVVPPNVQVNAARFNEIVSAAQTAGAQIINGTFGADDPARLTPTSAATIARQFADAAIIGDSNAVRINGGVISDLANVDFSTTTLTNAVASIGGNPDLLDPRTLANTGLAEGARIFQGAYDQASEVLRNIGGRTFVVPRTGETGGITDTASGSTQGTTPQAPDAAQQRLSQVSSTRPFVPIRATEDRYDFLTGRKVFSTAGDGAAGSGGGSGPGLGGGTRNLKGVRGTAPASFNGRASGSVNSVQSTDPEARTTPSTTYGQTDAAEGTFTNTAGQTYTQSDIESVENLRTFNEDIVEDTTAQEKLTPGEQAYLEDVAAEEAAAEETPAEETPAEETPAEEYQDNFQFPFIHPADDEWNIHTFDTGDRRADYATGFRRPFHLPASESDFVITRTNDRGGEIIIYVFQETDVLWFPFFIDQYEEESGEPVPFKNLDNIVRQPV